ncbi:MAG: bifunctional SulP family inorganic anion transporter/carbonic anhydrase [Deltaproteobacteria bacterium]|nr:bifunctional SulP family inorganic anion transporter/carbonic anhydrase [Nannocystaceae bacterium]
MSPRSDRSLTSGQREPLTVRWDLGVTALRPKWAALFDRRFLGRDAIAGVTVAFVAVPLSMAVALASGMPPTAGLITSIIAGMIGALMGGAPLAISGPTVAMAVLLASVVEEQGVAGLVIASLLAGMLQIVTGMLGLGRIARLVPLPVVLGFTAGIGVVILVGQLPRALGLPPPDQAHVIDVLTHIGEVISDARPASAVLAFGTLAIVLVGGRISKRVPSHLIGVLTATIVATGFGLDVERIGEIPRSLIAIPSFALPDGAWSELVISALVIYGLASLETLLSLSALDRIATSQKHDADQELIGQGLGTLAAVALGGLPSTSVIARSSLNVAAGARTRRAAFIHAVVVLLVVVAFAPLVGQIPVAALAGILLAVAVGMIAPGELFSLWKVSRSEALVYVVTLASLVLFDLLAGVRVGLVIAFVIAAIRLGKTDARVQTMGAHGPYRFTFRGAMTFMGLNRIDDVRTRMSELDPDRGVMLDLLGVPTIDVTSADRLAGLLTDLQVRGTAVAIVADGPAVHDALAGHDPEGRWTARIVPTQTDAMRMLGAIDEVTPFERLTEGVDRFRVVARRRYRELFEQLATAQSPHTLFIACSDSRVSPLLNSSEPGEVFVHRNIGNIVPRSGADGMPAEGAGVEYAVGVLGVKQIVVCGHSGCSAMGVISSGQLPPGLPSIAAWLSDAKRVCTRVPPGASPDAFARMNALMQLENLRTYDIVRRKLESGELTLHAWYYDIGEAEIEAWDPEKAAFAPLRSVRRERETKRDGDAPRERDTLAGPAPEESAAQ